MRNIPALGSAAVPVAQVFATLGSPDDSNEGYDGHTEGDCPCQCFKAEPTTKVAAWAEVNMLRGEGFSWTLLKNSETDTYAVFLGYARMMGYRYIARVDAGEMNELLRQARPAESVARQ